MSSKKRFSLLFFSLYFISGYAQQAIWLYLPHNGAITGDQGMVFEWRRKALTTTYTLQVSTDSLFTAPTEITTSNTNAKMTGLLYGQNYWWRVLGSGGEVSAVRKFEVMNLKQAGPLSLWLRADSAVTADGTGLVSQWTDLSDSARSGTQTEASRRPTRIPNSFNNLPSIRFGKSGGPGQHTFFEILQLKLNTPICVFSVQQHLSNTNVVQYMLCGTGNGVYYGAAGNASTGLSGGINAGSGLGEIYVPGVLFSPLSQFTWRKNLLRRNGINLNSIGTAGNFSVTRLGTRPGAEADFTHARVPEFILYKSALPDSTRDKIERYLASKYARPARLPADTILCGPSITLTLPGGTEEFSAISWSTGATGTSITINLNGTYWVRGTSRLGGYITTDTIRVGGVLPNPVITPTQPQFLCASRDSVTIRNLTANPNYTFQWSTGSAADTIRVSDVGAYYLQAVDAPSGCILTSDTVKLIHKTLADFDNSPACPGVNASFEDLSFDFLGDTIVSWSWNYGDPNTSLDVSSDTNGVWIYPPPSNTYSVYLRVEASDGCADSIQKTVLIKPTSTPSFSWQGPCYGKFTQFVNTSVPETGTSVDSCIWNFGPGVISTQTNPITTFDTAGVYQVSLTVVATSRCRETITEQIPVNKGANAVFSLPDSVCAGQPITIQEGSMGENDDIVQWLWRFGNSAPISGQNPDFAFQTSGNRIVRLTVTTSAGCTDSAQAVVWVNPSPTASFSLATGGGNPPATAQVLNSSMGALNYTWLLNEAFYSSDMTPTFPTWNDTGNYVISLIANNAFGCLDTATRTFTVFTGERSLKLTDAQCEKDGEYMKYRARILNNGVLNVTEIQLSALVNYENTFKETWSGNLMPGQELDYVFTGSPKLFGSDEFCCVQIENYNDTLKVAPPDDRLCRVLDNGPWFSLPYPNPADGLFTLDFILPFADKLTIRLSDAGGKDLGHVVKSQSYGAGFHTITHDLSELRSGMYFLKVFYRDRVFRMKVVKR